MPTYSISFVNPPSGEQNSSVQITAKVVNNHNTPVEGVAVSWSYGNAQSGSPSTSLSGTTTVGDGTTTSPSVPYTSGEQRTVTVKATVGGVSDTVNVQYGADLPSGFIAYAGENNKKGWVAAGEYCTSQGGSLPAPGSYSVGGMPTGVYWSSGEVGADVAAFLISDGSILYYDGGAFKTSQYQVVCVP
jgi:hypothetical protein